MNDPYVYEGTDILINLKDIKNQNDLDEYENAMSSLAIMKLIKEDIEVKSLKDIFLIHKTIFKNVYSWAGETRKINMFKEEIVLNGLSVDYTDYKHIKEKIDELDQEFINIDFNKLTKKDFVKYVVYFFSKLWKIHPFREGNTMAVSSLMYLFVKKNGLKINIDFISKHAKFFRNALVLNSIGEYSEPEHLENFITDALIIEDKHNSKEKYESIKGYKLDNYQYTKHSYKK